MRLEADGDATILHYTVKAEVGGKIAQLGSRLIDSTAKKLAGEFFENFGEAVAPSPEEPSEDGEKPKANGGNSAGPEPPASAGDDDAGFGDDRRQRPVMRLIRTRTTSCTPKASPIPRAAGWAAKARS